MAGQRLGKRRLECCSCHERLTKKAYLKESWQKAVQKIEETQVIGNGDKEYKEEHDLCCKKCLKQQGHSLSTTTHQQDSMLGPTTLDSVVNQDADMDVLKQGAQMGIPDQESDRKRRKVYGEEDVLVGDNATSTSNMETDANNNASANAATLKKEPFRVVDHNLNFSQPIQEKGKDEKFQSNVAVTMKCPQCQQDLSRRSYYKATWKKAVQRRNIGMDMSNGNVRCKQCFKDRREEKKQAKNERKRKFAETKEDPDCTSQIMKGGPTSTTTTCTGCNLDLSRDKFHKRQWSLASNNGESHTVRCIDCIAKEEASKGAFCSNCNSMRPQKSFAIQEWEQNGNRAINCKQCVHLMTLVTKKQCSYCNVMLPKTSFYKSQWKNKITSLCKECTMKITLPDDFHFNAVITKMKDREAVDGGNDECPRTRCRGCSLVHPKDMFADTEWKKHEAHNEQILCQLCTLRQKGPMGSTCGRCTLLLPKDSFSKAGWKQILGGTQSVLCEDCTSQDFPPNVPTRDSKMKKKKESGPNETKKSMIVDPAFMKSKLIERALVLLASGRFKTFRLNWATTNLVSPNDEDAIAREVVVPGCYGPANDDVRAHIRECIESSSMTMEQAISFRKLVLTQKASHIHRRLAARAKMLHESYRGGKNIIELAMQADGPPMTIFRLVLAEMKFEKAKINRSLRDPEKYFEKRELEEFYMAEAADIVSNVDQTRLHQVGREFEDVLAEWLKQKGITFVRQEQLQMEQENEFGKAILTPDFLILDQVVINNQPVSWIDVKSYYGCNIPFQVARLKKQMARYIEHWGSGAVVYKMGFCAGLVLNGCTILDANHAGSAEDLSRIIETI